MSQKSWPSLSAELPWFHSIFFFFALVSFSFSFESLPPLTDCLRTNPGAHLQSLVFVLLPYIPVHLHTVTAFSVPY